MNQKRTELFPMAPRQRALVAAIEFELRNQGMVFKKAEQVALNIWRIVREQS